LGFGFIFCAFQKRIEIILAGTMPTLAGQGFQEYDSDRLPD
jgi:hypothetical protein